MLAHKDLVARTGVITTQGVRTPMAALTRRDFFHDVLTALRGRLPGELVNVRIAQAQHLLKVYYAEPRIHYEVWVNGRDRHIEIGFHFEDGPESTQQLLLWLDRHILELKHKLGPDTELERWTPGWGHLYQHLPYQPLTEALADDIACRLAHFIVVTEPLVREWRQGRTLAVRNHRRRQRPGSSLEGDRLVLAGDS